MADLALIEAPAQHADDIMAGDTSRLVDNRDSMSCRWFATRHQLSAGAAPPPLSRSRSARRMSSILAAERIT
jgi:hypothetical protein